MGLYLNQLPPTEVARLKAELAETLIANFCYPRFYDYRSNALRTRPIDRSKRQEVWQYLNAVDFNVWGRVDVDSADFQHQVERLFIHFVQRNRNFFGEQGRKRMADVRSLIANNSLALAEGMRKHLQGKQSNPPLGSPRPVSTWATLPASGRPEPSWEQILNSTMQLQQQMQEVRGEVRMATASAPHSAVPAATPAPAARSNTGPEVAARRSRAPYPAAANAPASEKEALAWPPTDNRPSKTREARVSVSFPAASSKESAPAYPPFPQGAAASAADAAPTLPLPLGKPENVPPSQQPTRVMPEVSARSGQLKADTPPGASFIPTRPAGPLGKSQPQSMAPVPQSTPRLPAIASPLPGAELAVKQSEPPALGMSDEDIVIFEQLHYQLLVELRVEVVRCGIELNGQNAFQLVEALRQQNGMETSRLQIISTLLNMCEQIISQGHATPTDYKQAMMFYLMHTRRSR